MTFERAHALVEQVSNAVAELRTTLEKHELPGLETAILNSQMALKALEDHPGGVEGLRQLIATFPEAKQQELNTRLEQARADHQLNSDLIRLAMQRNAALQALEDYPGGVEGLRQFIATLPEDEQTQLNTRLTQARDDHQLNTDLINLAMQRNAALQAYAAQSSAGATYSSEGGVSFLGGGQLLGKF